MSVETLNPIYKPVNPEPHGLEEPGAEEWCAERRRRGKKQLAFPDGCWITLLGPIGFLGFSVPKSLFLVRLQAESSSALA